MSDEVSKRTAVVVIHGVGDAKSGWINDSIIAPMAKERTTLECLRHSELYQLSVKDEDEDAQKFSVVVRRAKAASHRIEFIEMTWAGLSRFTGGAIAYFLATANLLFVAPCVLAQAFLRRRWLGLHRLAALLIVISTRLLSWFIVGLNATFLFCTAFVVSLWWLQSAKVLPYWEYGRDNAALWLLLPTIGLLAFGIWAYLTSRTTNVGWAQFGLGIAISSGAVLLYAALQDALPSPLPCEAPSFFCDFVGEWTRIDKQDFDKGRDAVFLIWLLWCVCILLSMLFLTIIHIGRFIGWGTQNNFPCPHRGSLSL